MNTGFANSSFANGKRERCALIFLSILCVIFFVIIIIQAIPSKNSSPIQVQNTSISESTSPTPCPNSNTEEPTSPVPPTSFPFQNASTRICTTEECIRSAADIMLSMNSSVDPCDDFYRFSCERWGSRHPDHKWFSQNTAFAVVEERLSIESIKFFKRKGTPDEPKPVRQSRDFFSSCLDEDTRDDYGYKPVFEYLSQIGLPHVPRYFNMSATNEDIKSYKFDWIKTDANMNKLLDIQLFVDCDVTNNMYDTSKNTIVFGVPKTKILGYESLAISRKQHEKLMAIEDSIGSKNDSADDKIIKARLNLMAFTFKTLISEKYELPFDFSERMFNAFLAIADIEILLQEIKEKTQFSMVDHYSKISVSDLQKHTDIFVKKKGLNPKNLWKKYLDVLFEGIGVSLDLNEDVIHMLPEHKTYYAGIAVALASELDAKIELWTWWKAVRNLIIHTTSDAKEIIDKLFSALDVDMKPSQDVSCASLTKTYMDYAVTYGLADRSFLNTTKPKVETMWNNIKDAFEIRVNSLTWMDAKIKKITIEKSREMTHNIGFPEWLLNKYQLEKYYSTLTINDGTYLNNLVETIKLKRKHTLERLHLRNVKYWSQNPLMVNAYNNIFGNIINIPMAMINYPFYNRGIDVLNYGSLATILGHELTHGFDDTGRKYDKHGNYQQWWSHSTILYFVQKTKCFIMQYNKFYVPEVDAYINGAISLGENIADNGGLHHAYLAYQNHKKKMGEEIKLPGLEKYTNDQLFFMSYANVWCDEEEVASLKISVKEDHCPNKYRVLGTLMNSEEFAAAFNCPMGSKMNPLTPKCKIW